MDGGARRESPDSSAQSKSPSTLRNFMHGNRETSGVSVPARAADRREKAKGRTTRMHAPEESDCEVVHAGERVALRSKSFLERVSVLLEFADGILAVFR